MSILSFLVNLLLFPLERLGWTLSALGRLSRYLLEKFLLSPWGLLVPITLLIALFLAMRIEKTPVELAEKYASEWEHCENARIPVLIEAMLNLGDPGIPALVQGLRSEREDVFLACQQTLHEELKRWETLQDRNRRYTLLSQALLDQVREFRPVARNAVFQLVRQILYRSSSAPTVQVTRNCEKILLEIERTRKNRIDPSNPFNAPTSDGLARFSRSFVDPVLMAADGTPFQSRGSDGGAFDEERFTDTLAVARTERLLAYHDSPLYRKQLADRRSDLSETPHPGKEEPTAELLASMTPAYRALGENVNTLVPVPAETEGKIAGQYREPDRMGIADDYLSKSSPGRSTGPTGEQNVFLTTDLMEIQLSRIPFLPSPKLMRLLQHPDERIVAEARKTLVARDGFLDAHLKLAFRLYHPLPSVREEAVSLLTKTNGIQLNVWLAEVLNDPDNEVRYRAASFLATTADPKMLRLLVDRGKRDSDPRIVRLAEQLQGKK